MKLDDVDIQILGILQKDGRISFRELGKEIGVSTPTISSKVSRLEDIGVIKDYSAIVDSDILGEVPLVLTIKSKPSDLEAIVNQLKDKEEVREMYITADSEIYIEAMVVDMSDVKHFLSELENIPEITSYRCSTVIRTIKNEQRARITKGLSLTLMCGYCKRLIKGEPVKLKIAGKEHYMCCEICAESYKEKYEKLKNRIE